MPKKTGVCNKVWIEVDGEPVFGQGLAGLITAIDAMGSLQEAAAQLRMSYRHAWEKIKKAEARLGESLVARQAGGLHGGGSGLTPAGRRYLVLYKQLSHEVDSFVSKRFEELWTAGDKHAST